MKRFPEQLIGWNFFALTTLAIFFPLHDLWSNYRFPEQANLALKTFLLDAFPGVLKRLNVMENHFTYFTFARTASLMPFA